MPSAAAAVCASAHRPAALRSKEGCAVSLIFMLWDLRNLVAGASALAALVVLGVLVSACEKKASSAAGVPLFELPEWRGLTPEYGDQVSLRRESEGAGALLMKHRRRRM